MACNFPPDFRISPNVRYDNFHASFTQNIICPMTYLRPDPGGALIPWLYALFLLLFHLPSCIIRAVRWESGQYLALVLAVVTIALTSQAYQSTELRAEEILVWTPLTLILDVGAMLQLVVLIIEKHGIAELKLATKIGLKRAKSVLARVFPGHNKVQAIVNPEPSNPDTLRHTVVGLVAFILLLILVTLQLSGLAAAIKGLKRKNLMVKWCSPAFRDFSLAITTGNCDKYDIMESRSNGIGCIALPAHPQRGWLVGTVICVSAALVFQILDMLLLRCASARKCRGVKMQRPWLTMFSGILVLVVIMVCGIYNSNSLPDGVTNMVWIYRKEPTAEFGRVCQVNLTSPGLRGAILGWTDGIFEKWSTIYYGSRPQI